MEKKQERPAPRPVETNTRLHSSRRLDIKTVAEAALASAEAVVSRWLPDGSRQGNEWLSLNPTRADAHAGSFSVNLATGRWADFATGDKGGDLVSLVAYLEGTNQGAAAETLGAALGMVPTDTETRPQPATRTSNQARPRPPPTAKSATGPAPMRPIPAAAEESRPKRHPTRGNPSQVWCYHDAAGNALVYIYRFPTTDKDGNPDKTFRPCTYWPEHLDDSGSVQPAGWKWRNLPVPRPLYGLDRLAARRNVSVLICEGEKAADAATRLLPAMVATTTMNGADGTRKADFAPLRGRRVFIWPDADEAGATYARAVAELAHAAGAESVSVLDLASLAGGPPHD